MVREDFIHHFPQTNKRWRDAGYLVNANKLMMALIFATAKLDWVIDDSRGPREVWYNPIKPIVMRALGLRANRNDGPFEKLLSQLVKKGKLSYADLGIVDFRTMRETYENINKGKCWKNILLFVEKDSAFIHLLPLKRLLNITIMSGAGWSNTSGIEAQLVELQARGVTKIEVFTITDYDPFGFAIDREFVDKCSMMGFTVEFHKRIGIGIEHTTPELLDVQKYPIAPNKKLTVNGIPFNSNEWLAEKGIEGQYGIEIEAISGQLGGHAKLRAIVLKELLKHLEEYDRIWEITKRLWTPIPRSTIENYLDNDTVEYWDLFSPNEVAIDRYITPELYESISERITEEMDDNLIPYRNELGRAQIDYDGVKGKRDIELTDAYTFFEGEIKTLQDRFINPVRAKASRKYDLIHDEHRDDVESAESKMRDIRDWITDITERYDDQKLGLDFDYHKSRSLYAEAHYSWLRDRIQKYIDIATETEPLSFGLMKGCIMKALEDGDTLEDIIRRANLWDKNQIYEYIGNELDSNFTVYNEIDELLYELIRGKLTGDDPEYEEYLDE